MSHDAATGYIKPGSFSPSGITWQYSKNQVGSVYRQLDDGARALDLRPKLLSNGTVIFQHGSINIPVLFETLVSDAVKWCADNPDELVLLLSSDFAYQTSSSSAYVMDDDFNGQDSRPRIVSAMGNIYETMGVTYAQCGEVYGLTIAEIMGMAELPMGGYLIALDGQDYYGTPCAKPNWVVNSLVGCYSTYNNKTLSCAHRDQVKVDALKRYMLASANNEPTDYWYVLGPPSNIYKYPLNEVQALWQVTSASAVIGASRLSSILKDNEKSRLNEEIIDMIYDGQFNSISILAVDNVALHGNALLSVIRTSCGQASGLSSCGKALSKPNLVYFHISKAAFALLVTVYVVVVLWIGVSVVVAIHDREDNPHPLLLYTIFHRLSDKMCQQSIEDTGSGIPGHSEELQQRGEYVEATEDVQSRTSQPQRTGQM
jgi:hypothetical protein